MLTPDLSALGGVANYYRALDFREVPDGVETFAVNSGARNSTIDVALRLARNYLRFWRRIGHESCRVVVINPSLTHKSFYRDAVFCWLAHLRHKTAVVFFRGWAEDFEQQIRKPGFARTVFLHSFARARHFIVLSDTFRRKLLSMGCRVDARFWIESTVADDSQLDDFSINERLHREGPLRLLFMSRLVAPKGPRLAIDAFALAQSSLPPRSIRLAIAGDGPEREPLGKLIKELKLPDASLLGAVSGLTKHQLLKDSDVLVFPSSYGEGMPNVVLEAMLYGMPVIARNVGAIPDVITHLENGFLVEGSQPSAVASCIERLAVDHDLFRKMALTNHERAARLYTTRAVRARMRAIFDAVLESTPG